jgi:hypothetical protein
VPKGKELKLKRLQYGSMVAVAGAALFLTQLGQMLQMLGLLSALQFVIQGLAIALGMALSRLDLSSVRLLIDSLARIGFVARLLEVGDRIRRDGIRSIGRVRN